MQANRILPPIVPPFRYGMVESNVFRGAYPKERNLRFLKRLKLKTILSLIPDQPTQELVSFCRENGIMNMMIRVKKPKENVPLNFSKVVQILEIVINPEYHPLYLHCVDGTVVTGVVIMCLRKLQLYSVPSALTEFARYLRDGVVASEESEFIERFTSEINIPKEIPDWLWGGQITFKKHPTLKIKLSEMPLELSESKKTEEKKSNDLLGDLLVPKGDINAVVNGSSTVDQDNLSQTLQALALEGIRQ
ncbi:protein-tyrosine-phosphatase [Basidiobolus ranarum]|uniref:Protein-tyrosine-phosphatase n=1 Tax=Basidiobolus ranarum TaxID=34480 RepID=A0ABR2WKE1_9FUNG